jgi:hypothetical protein
MFHEFIFIPKYLKPLDPFMLRPAVPIFDLLRDIIKCDQFPFHIKPVEPLHTLKGTGVKKKKRIDRYNKFHAVTNDLYLCQLKNLNGWTKKRLIETRNKLKGCAMKAVEKMQIIGRMIPEEVLEYFKVEAGRYEKTSEGGNAMKR